MPRTEATTGGPSDTARRTTSATSTSPFAAARADAGELWRRFRDDDVPGLGAELAFRFLFAIFPFGIFVAALGSFVAGWLGIEDPTGRIVSGLGDNLPANLAGFTTAQLREILGHRQPGLLSLGALFALYAAAGGTNALMKGISRSYEVRETRPLLMRYALAIGLTLLGGVGVVASFVTIVGGAIVTQTAATRAGIDPNGLIGILRWPIVFAVLTVAVAVVFRYAGNVRPPWRWALIGAAVFGLLWLVATFLLAFYVTNVANYNATYGAVGGVIVLMLWFYVTSIVLVSSAELVAVLVRAHDPAVLEARRNEISLASVEADLRTVETDTERALGRLPAPGKGRPSGPDAPETGRESEKGAATGA